MKLSVYVRHLFDIDRETPTSFQLSESEIFQPIDIDVENKTKLFANDLI